jgi:hypothetical protein
MVKYASIGITVFTPCNTVLVYVTHSTVQVRTQPPYTQVCVCVYMHGQMCPHIHELRHVGTSTHEHRYTMLPPHTHTHGTYNHTYKWEHIVMDTHRHVHTHVHACECTKISKYAQMEIQTHAQMWICGHAQI